MEIKETLEIARVSFLYPPSGSAARAVANEKKTMSCNCGTEQFGVKYKMS